jgi:hypothetical protein
MAAAKRKRLILSKLEDLDGFVDNQAHHTNLDFYNRRLQVILKEIVESLPE